MTYTGTSFLGIAEQSLVEDFVAYPVPVKDLLNLDIKLVSSVNALTEIYNFTGQKVISKTLNLLKGENLVNLDLSSLASGLYNIRITSSNGIRIIQTIVKK
jgi:hypothetical protein